MRARFPDSQDFWAGVLFVFFGGVAIWIAQDYPFGSARRMGPGYFPIFLGSILCLLGMALVLRGLVRGTEVLQRSELRPFLALIAIVTFALLVKPAGILVATALLVFVASLAGREFRIVEVLISTVMLAAFAAVVFVWGLGVQLPLLPGW